MSKANLTALRANSQTTEKMPVLGTEHPTLRNNLLPGDEQRRTVGRAALGEHTENGPSHDPLRNLLVLPQIYDQSWSNTTLQRPLTGQRQKAWVERRLRSFAGNSPLRGVARRFEVSGRKRLPARQNSNYRYLNHTRTSVKHNGDISPRTRLLDFTPGFGREQVKFDFSPPAIPG